MEACAQREEGTGVQSNHLVCGPRWLSSVVNGVVGRIESQLEPCGLSTQSGVPVPCPLEVGAVDARDERDVAQCAGLQDAGDPLGQCGPADRTGPFWQGLDPRVLVVNGEGGPRLLAYGVAEQ